MRVHTKRTAGVLAAVGVVVTILVGFAGPAAAGTNLRVRTTDADPGGEGYFKAHGDVVRACDIQGDGYGVFVGLDVGSRSRVPEVIVFDDNGSGNGCQSTGASWIAEGTTVRLQVCLNKSGNQFCSAWKRGTA